MGPYDEKFNTIFMYTELYSLGRAEFKKKYPSAKNLDLAEARNEARRHLMRMSEPGVGQVNKKSPSQQSAAGNWAKLAWDAQNGKDFSWDDFMHGIKSSDLESWFPGFKYDSLTQGNKKAA